MLISDHATDAVKKRLSFLCHTNDGFEIAKFDLETRGPGDFFGSRQHGLPTLRIADLMADSRALYAAQKEALALVGADPALRSPGNAAAGPGGGAPPYRGGGAVGPRSCSPATRH